jgi:putative membrane protein
MSDSKLKSATGEKPTDSFLDLAVKRTQLALERTHLAWIRTMFTLITAGVAIDKGFAYIHEKRIASGTAFVNNAHVIGLTLTSAGTILLLIGAIQFVKRNRQLAYMTKEKFKTIPITGILSFLVILLGLALAILMITNR